MWTVRDGRLVYSANLQHTRTALGSLGSVPDVVEQIERNHAA